MTQNDNMPYVFFGTPDFSVQVLSQLSEANLLPEVVVTAPDRKRDRGQNKKPSAVKSRAQNEGVEVMTPERINKEFIKKLQSYRPETGWPVFVVVAYGKILPSELIYLPTHNTLNVHPSLLPKMRGAAPIRGTILHEDQAGVTIIELDEKMDHGPIVTQKVVKTDDWPPRYDDLKHRLASTGGKLLASTLPKWVAGDISTTPQDHDQATYIEKFCSDDGEINLSDPPTTNLRKVRAFTNWPKAHFYTDDGKRIIITEAHIKGDSLIIDRVKPAGKPEVSYDEFTSNQ